MTRTPVRLLQLGTFSAMASLFLEAPGVTSPFPSQSLVLGGLLSVGVGFFLAWQPRLARRGLWALALLGWSCVCGLFSLDLYRSECEILSLGTATAVLLATTTMIGRKADWRLWSRLLLALAFASCLAGWLSLAQQGWALNARLSSNWTNSDCFSVVPLVAVFLSGAELGRGGRSQALYIAAALFFLATLLLTWSRSSWLGLGIGLATVLARGALGKSARVKQSLLFLFCAVLTLAIFLVASGRWWHLHQRVQRTWGNPYDIPIRVELMATSIVTALHRPVLGAGPGAFSLAYQEFRPVDTPVPDFVNVAHNDTLQVLVECGVVGFGLWIGLLATAWRSASSAGEGWRSEGAWIGGAMAALVCYSLFNFAIPVPAALAWWYAVLGLALAIPQRPPAPEISQSSCWKLALALAVMGTFAAGDAMRIALARHACLQAETLARSGQSAQALEAISVAIGFQPRDASLWLRRAAIGQALTGAEASSAEVPRDLEAAFERSPRDPEVWKARLQYATSVADGEGARQMAGLAHRYAPYERRFARLYAGFEAKAGHLESAARLLSQIPDEPPASLATILYALLSRGPSQYAAGLAHVEPRHRGSVGKVVLELALENKDALAVSNFFRWALEQPRHDSARTTFEWSRALDRLGDERTAFALLDALLSQIGSDHELYPEVLAAWSRHQGATGTSRLSDYLDSAPESSIVRAALAERLSTAAALELLGEGLSLAPHDPLLLEEMGDVFLRDRLYELGFDYYRQALENGGDTRRLNDKLSHSH